MYRILDIWAADARDNQGGTRPAWTTPYGLVEKIWVVLWTAIALITAAFQPSIPGSTAVMATAAAMIAAVLVVPQLTFRLGGRAYGLGRIALSIASGGGTYHVAAEFIAAFRSTSYEMEMLRVDQWLLGGDPSVWAQSLIRPALTEFLQLAYVGYFPMLLLVSLGLLATGKRRHFFTFILAMNLTVITLHICYVLVPVRSPFLIAHQDRFSSMISYSVPLEGLWWTDTLRKGLLDATAMRYDCFPSGHTMHSLLAMYFGWKAHPIIRNILLVLGGTIIFSTIYLRYHYAVDLIAAAGFMVVLTAASYWLTDKVWAEEPTPRVP